MNLEKRKEAVEFLRCYLKNLMIRESDLIPFYQRIHSTDDMPSSPEVPIIPLFKKKFEEDKDWFVKGHHLGIGMGLRNLLRSAGFGEKELGVENLDDYYVDILIEAIQ